MLEDGYDKRRCWKNVTLCVTARSNIEDRLQSQGYGLVVERENGMPRFILQDVLEVPKFDTTGELVCFLHITDVERMTKGVDSGKQFKSGDVRDGSSHESLDPKSELLGPTGDANIPVEACL